jgi:hypothetical protein
MEHRAHDLVFRGNDLKPFAGDYKVFDPQFGFFLTVITTRSASARGATTAAIFRDRPSRGFTNTAVRRCRNAKVSPGI